MNNNFKEVWVIMNDDAGLPVKIFTDKDRAEDYMDEIYQTDKANDYNLVQSFLEL